MTTISQFIRGIDSADLRNYLAQARACGESRVAVLDGETLVSLPVSVIEAELVARARVD